VTTERIAWAIKAAVEGIAAVGPRDLVAEVNRNLEDDDITVDEATVVTGITGGTIASDPVPHGAG